VLFGPKLSHDTYAPLSCVALDLIQPVIATVHVAEPTDGCDLSPLAVSQG
jgi:hypothetical protein